MPLLTNAAGPFFVLAGLLHFAKPEVYEPMGPAALPARRGLVYASGAAELVGGLGLIDRRAPVRRASGAWLVATLVAVFPANVHMARHAERFARTPLGRVALWARLPVQAVFIAWVIAAARRDRAGEGLVSRSPR
jgi:uncharacterized membrane protein